VGPVGWRPNWVPRHFVVQSATSGDLARRVARAAGSATEQQFSIELLEWIIRDQEQFRAVRDGHKGEINFRDSSDGVEPRKVDESEAVRFNRPFPLKDLTGDRIGTNFRDKLGLGSGVAVRAQIEDLDEGDRSGTSMSDRETALTRAKVRRRPQSAVVSRFTGRSGPR
jgi:hypothetical protein